MDAESAGDSPEQTANPAGRFSLSGLLVYQGIPGLKVPKTCWRAYCDLCAFSLAFPRWTPEAPRDIIHTPHYSVHYCLLTCLKCPDRNFKLVLRVSFAPGLPLIS